MKNLIFFLFLLTQVQASAQAPRKLKQDTRFELKIENPSLVLTPSPMDSSTKYPVIVFLPYTGGTAKDYYNIYLSQILGESGEMAYEELELYLNHFADSLKRIPTEDEIFEYMQDLKAKADRNTPAENRKFNSLLQMLFGDDVKNKAFIAVIPSGAGSANDHSWEGFEACIFRYENRILTDIDSLSRIYNIDQSKIILAGFSLGGDLGWAISQRYPEKFKGAIVNGSRCGYAEKGMMQRQAKQGVKYCIAMGEHEPEVRMNGAKSAITALDNAGIKNKFITTPNAEHDPATVEQFTEALNFILFE